MDDKPKNPIVQLFTNVKIMIGAIVVTATVIGSIWTIDDRYAKESELTNSLKESEARILSELRSEAADTRLILIEDMESRLDEYDYDISVLEANGEPVSEVLRIKRNMLDRRIQRLKNNEITDSND